MGGVRRNGGARAQLELVLFTTRAATSYLDHRFTADDVLLFGRESSGVPDAVHAAADARLTIPMRAGPALAQRRDGLRHGGRRGAAADARSSELSGIPGSRHRFSVDEWRPTPV